MLWFYLHCYQLQLDRLENAGSAPIGIYAAKDNCFVQLNQMALDAGVTINMGLGSASALCAELQIVQYNPELEHQYLLNLAEQLYLLVADIHLCPPQGIALRLDTVKHYYQGYPALLSALQSTLTQQALHYRYGCAQSVCAARLLASAGHNQLLLTAAQQQQALQQVALSRSELSNKTIEKLRRSGIQYVGELLQVPLHEVVRRFDQQTLRYINQLKGIDRRPVTLYHPSEYFHVTIELAFHLEDTQRLTPYLQQLFKQLEQFLQLRNKATQQVMLRLMMQDNDQQQTLDIRAGQTQSSASEWLTLTALRLEQLELTAPITHVQLECRELEAFSPEHGDFFNAHPQRYQRAALIGRLRARLGQEQVTYCAAQADPRPLINTVDVLTPQEGEGPSIALPATFELAQPQPLTQPTRIIYGPVRIITGWWDQQPIKRDYFIALGQNGQRLWVFKTDQDEWFLQSWYC